MSTVVEYTIPAEPVSATVARWEFEVINGVPLKYEAHATLSNGERGVNAFPDTWAAMTIAQRNVVKGFLNLLVENGHPGAVITGGF